VLAADIVALENAPSRSRSRMMAAMVDLFSRVGRARPPRSRSTSTTRSTGPWAPATLVFNAHYDEAASYRSTYTKPVPASRSPSSCAKARRRRSKSVRHQHVPPHPRHWPRPICWLAIALCPSRQWLGARRTASITSSARRNDVLHAQIRTLADDLCVPAEATRQRRLGRVPLRRQKLDHAAPLVGVSSHHRASCALYRHDARRLGGASL